MLRHYVRSSFYLKMYLFFRMATSPPPTIASDGEVLFGLVNACVTKVRAAWHAVRPSIEDPRQTDDLISAMEGFFQGIENNFFRMALMRSDNRTLQPYEASLQGQLRQRFQVNKKKII